MATYELGWINEQASKNTKNFIEDCEKNYIEQIEKIANELVLNRNEKPIILLCGPSSSGKTTTADRLCKAIRKNKIKVDTISMDDYYLSRNTYEIPWDDENGVYDFESPNCMDLPLLHKHLEQLVCGEQIEIPTFDFEKKLRLDTVKKLALSPDSMVVIEGIHAFNDVLMGGLEKKAEGVYISVASGVNTKNTFLTAEHLRFCRRAVRDANFRDASVDVTIKQWKSVRRGERIYIDPYKGFANYNIDSYLAYETLIFVDILKKDFEQKRQQIVDAGLCDILECYNLFEKIDYLSYIPQSSVLHEFIG